jgi:hypothetical protein
MVLTKELKELKNVKTGHNKAQVGDDEQNPERK